MSVVKERTGGPNGEPSTIYRWRPFPVMEIREALAFAEAGGIAVHDNPLGKEWAAGGAAAHMFAPDDDTLITAARQIGCKKEWVQTERRLYGRHAHFDLKGKPLRLALAKCETA